MNATQIKKLALAALEDTKAQDIVTLDTRKLSSLFDYLIVASGQSTRQVKAQAQHVAEAAKAKGVVVIGSEGLEAGDWALVDLGDVVVHVMQPAIRAYYQLEEIWQPVLPMVAKTRARRATTTA